MSLRDWVGRRLGHRVTIPAEVGEDAQSLAMWLTRQLVERCDRIAQLEAKAVPEREEEAERSAMFVDELGHVEAAFALRARRRER